MMIEEAAACHRVLRFASDASPTLPSLPASLPQPPTKQGPELRCSGMPPLLSSGIRARHLERGTVGEEEIPKR